MAANQLTTGERIWQAKRKTFPDPSSTSRVLFAAQPEQCLRLRFARLGGVSTLSGAGVIQ